MLWLDRPTLTLQDLAKARLNKRRGRAQGPRLSLREYVEQCWSLVEPNELVWERHMTEVCNHLEYVLWTQRPSLAPAHIDLSPENMIRQLIVNVPPGTSKSLLTCVFFPSWCWTYDPGLKFIYASYDAGLSRRDAVRARNLIDSEWYTDRWGELQSEDMWSATYYVNKYGGSRLSTSVGGRVTGNHADIQVVDDPIKPLETSGGAATTRMKLNECLEWWGGTMASRLVSALKSARIIIMQRLHMLDLAGQTAKTGTYVHLRLPMEYEPELPCVTPVGGDWRTQAGELLLPLRYPREAVERMKVNLGSAQHVAAQLQQRPVPAGGGIFKKTWFTRTHTKLPARLRVFIQSWDMRFKDDADSGDFVVGQVWGLHDGTFYLVDQVRGRWSFTETCEAMLALTAKYPNARLKLVENAANGAAVVDNLKKRVSGIVLINPDGGKVARANAVAPLFEAGNISLPANAPWLGEFVEEFTLFPKGMHDDQVDSATQALNRLYVRDNSGYAAAMENVRRGIYR